METVLQLKVGHSAIDMQCLSECLPDIASIILTSNLQPDQEEAQTEIAEVRVLVLQRKQQPCSANKRTRTY